jgi:hypothetical protein
VGLPACVDVPEPDKVVSARSRKKLSVRVECKGEDNCLLAEIELCQLFAARRIPDSCCPVPGSRRDPLPVFMEGHVIDELRMSSESVVRFDFLSVPQFNR